VRLSRLMDTRDPDAGLQPREVSVELPAGRVLLAHYPVAREDRELPTHDLLNRYLTNWNVTSEDDTPVPLNADALMALKPEVRDAFREAILAHPRARAVEEEPAVEQPAEKAPARAAAGEKKNE
jgi:hypothetical protein